MEKDFAMLVMLLEEFRDAVENGDGEHMAIYSRMIEKNLPQIKERNEISLEKMRDAEKEFSCEYYKA